MGKYDHANYKSNVARVKYVLTEEETNALKEIGKLGAAAVRANAPVGKTKRLKRYIGYSLRKKDKSVQIGVKSKIYYAGFVELGHRVVPRGHYYHKKSGEIKKPQVRKGFSKYSGKMVPGKKFTINAIEPLIPKMQEIIKDYLKRLEGKS
jgi:HK97 gp10 family phage protein